MYEIYTGTMPTCTACLDGQHEDCLDLDMPTSPVYGPYACGCEGC